MLTYNDLQEIGDNEKERMQFVLRAIEEHRSSDIYKQAVIADKYASGHNVTISKYQKILYTLMGDAVPDNYTANHKCKSGFFKRFVTQRVSYLLGNGATFLHQKETKRKLGNDFDNKLYFIAKYALIESVAFGFFNYDRVDFFRLTEFVPLYDEEDGSLKAGVRFWRLSPDKPLRATLYEMDGYTEYIRPDGEEIQIKHEKRAYIQVRQKSEIEDKIYDLRNYDGFPIVPLWANYDKQSTLVGIREQIDSFDLIKSGFANDLDDASMIYWTLENCGAMDDVDLAEFINRMKTLKAAVLNGNGTKATAHTLDVPYQSREAYLARLKKDLYEDYMALDTEQIAAGNVTATQINAAYEPLNEATDEFEYYVIDFVKGILDIAGIEDEPKFKRSQIKNQNEETEMIISAASYLDSDTVLEKLPFLTNDEVETIKKRKAAEDIMQVGGGTNL